MSTEMFASLSWSHIKRVFDQKTLEKVSVAFDLSYATVLPESSFSCFSYLSHLSEKETLTELV